MSDAQTVQVRVQVVDVQPSTLDLVLPAFLPAGDLVQRIARDAGLDSFTSDGRRRAFWLRARGRVMEEQETLSDLQIVPHETLHLLPEPPAGSGVVEQEGFAPDVAGPEGTLRTVLALTWPLVWAFLWGLALTVEREWYATLVPGLVLGMLSTSMARRIVRFSGRDHKLLLLSAGLNVLLLPLALVPSIYLGQGTLDVLLESSPGVVAVFLGSLIGWIAWWAPIEPLPARVRAESGISTAASEDVEALCGLCGGVVERAVQVPCPCGNGILLHRGCFNARRAVVAYNESDDVCAFCGQ